MLRQSPNLNLAFGDGIIVFVELEKSTLICGLADSPLAIIGNRLPYLCTTIQLGFEIFG
jgi:hypothetical protein